MPPFCHFLPLVHKGNPLVCSLLFVFPYFRCLDWLIDYMPSVHCHFLSNHVYRFSPWFKWQNLVDFSLNFRIKAMPALVDSWMGDWQSIKQICESENIFEKVNRKPLIILIYYYYYTKLYYTLYYTSYYQETFMNILVFYFTLDIKKCSYFYRFHCK